MKRAVIILVGIVFISPLRTNACTHRELIVAKGNRLTSPENIGDSERVTFQIEEVGRGAIPTAFVDVYFLPDSYEGNIPSASILVLQGPYSRSPKTGHYRIEALGREADRGILPFTEKRWNALLEMALEELLDTPEQGRIMPEEATEVLVAKLLQDESPPEQIYVYPPQRTAFGWTIRALYARKTQVMSIAAKVGDSRRIHAIRHQPRLVYDFQDDHEGLLEHVTDEMFENYISTTHQDQPSEEWPKRYR